MQLKATRELVAGIRFFYAESAGTVAARELGSGLSGAPWIERLTWLMQPGAQVHPEPGRRYFARAGFAVVTAGTVAECERGCRPWPSMLTSGWADIQVRWRPGCWCRGVY